jgi:release factor glutamine methyltransferase
MSERRFLGVPILTSAYVLMPREETELLGRIALERIRSMAAARPKSEPVRVIDMCCGSGNLACGLAYALPSVLVWACDLTDECVRLSRRNVTRLGLEERVCVLQGDLFAPLASLDLTERIDVVVCNPPYISTRKLATCDELQSEPREAFDGGSYGISIHQRAMREAAPYLRPGGELILEIGQGQERQVQGLFRRSKVYESIEGVRDEAGEVRVVGGRKRSAVSPQM